jgi:hypothetical protein
MRRSLTWHKPGLWAVGLSVMIWMVLGGLVSAQNIPASGLPSGLPDDLSDMSPFNPCQGNLQGMQPPRCPWYAEVDGIWLRRDRIDPVPLQTLGPVGVHAMPQDPFTYIAPGDVALSTDAFNAPYRAGGRVTVGRSLGESCWQIDGTYIAVGNWDDSAAIFDNTSNGVNTGNLFSPFSGFGQPLPNHGGFDYNDFVSVRESSQFQSVEMNLRYTVPMPHQCLTAKLLIGMRYIMINEEFDYYSHSNLPVLSPTSSQILGSSVSLATLTRNDLVGPQVGGEFYFYAYPCCWIDVGIKGAVCSNRAVQATTGALGFGNVALDYFESVRGRDTTAYVGDLDVQFVWQMWPHMLLRMGYQAIWVNDLALASRNFSESADILLHGPAQIDTIGRAVYHGPHIGLEFDW